MGVVTSLTFKVAVEKFETQMFAFNPTYKRYFKINGFDTVEVIGRKKAASAFWHFDFFAGISPVLHEPIPSLLR